MATTRSPPAIEAEPPSLLLDDHGAASSVTADMAALAIMPTPTSAPQPAGEQGETSLPSLIVSGHGSEKSSVVAELGGDGDDTGRKWSRSEKGKALEIVPSKPSIGELSSPDARRYDPVGGEPQPQPQTNTPTVGTSGRDSSILATHATPPQDLQNGSSSVCSPLSADAAANILAVGEEPGQDHVTVPWEEKGKEREKENPEIEAESPSSSESSSHENDEDEEDEDENEEDALFDEHFVDSDDDRKKAKGKGKSTNPDSGQGSPGGEGAAPAKLTLRFRDAVGRNFVLPWEKVRTFQGMRRIITAAFEGLFPLNQHVATGHYDLFVTLPISMDDGSNSTSTTTTTPSGPSSSASTGTGTGTSQQPPSSSFVILPEIWEDMIEPGMLVTMAMRPPPPPPPHPPPPAVSPVYGRGRGRGRGGGVGTMGTGHVFPGHPGRGGGFTPGPPLPPHPMMPPPMGMNVTKPRRNARSFRARRGPG